MPNKVCPVCSEEFYSRASCTKTCRNPVCQSSWKETAARRISDDDILVALVYYSTDGIALSIPKWNELKKLYDIPSVPTIYKRFGSWDAAVQKAGLNPSGKFSCLKAGWTDSKMIDAVQDISAAYGRVPNSAEFDEARKITGIPAPSSPVYWRRFGSWPKVCKLAGLDFVRKPLVRKDRQSDECLLETLREAATALGYPPVSKEFSRDTKRLGIKAKSIRVYFDRFGSWCESLRLAGLQHYRWIAEDGDRCDSRHEVAVDDWLSKRGISHERHVPYPIHQKWNPTLKYSLRCDFKVGDLWIECTGFKFAPNEEGKTYRARLKRKHKIAKACGLHMIEIDTSTSSDSLVALLRA